MAIDHTYYTQKRDKGLYLSIGFLLVVILATVAMYFYNVMLDNQNTELSNSIIHYDASIADIKKDKRLQVYELLKMNEKTISALAAKSNVSMYIKYLKAIGSKYDITFEGFNYGSGEIQSAAKIASDERGLAYAKITNFISGFRKLEDRKFDLLFINNLVGHDSISFNTRFKLK
jgi:hypothetical protein